MVQYANNNFDTYIKEADLIKNQKCRWVSQVIPGGFSRGWLKRHSEVCGQTVLPLGQASNSISYYRRFYMLQKILDVVGTNKPLQSKQMLRKDSELLQKNDKGFSGKKLRENIWHTSRSQMQTLEMLSNISRTKYKPFSPPLFPDTEKELLRATTIKASSQERNNVTVFKETIQ